MSKLFPAYLVVLLIPLACGLQVGPNLQELGENDSGLLPLKAGRAWNYAVISSNPGLCAAGNVSQSISAQKTISGRTAYVMSPICATQGEEQLAFDGQRVLLYYNGNWATALDVPLADGHGWSSDRSYEWSDAGTVSVTAMGKITTYEKCWQRRVINVTYNAYQTYCAGVGKVIDHFDGATGSYEARLYSRNF